MKLYSSFQRAAAALLCLLLCAVCLPQAFALDPFDQDQPCSLTLNSEYPNISFRLYRVGNVSASGRFSLSGDFRNYPVPPFSGLDSTGWRNMAETLAAYAAKDQLEPLAQSQTGENGSLTFSDLQSGLYLAVGEHTAFNQSGTTSYVTPVPFLVSLPFAQDDAWDYDVDVIPKFERSQDSSVMRRVLKVWDDEGHENRRPAQVSVSLLRNGEVYETVTLNDENNWRYVWENLDNSYRWQIVEDYISSRYEVSISFQGVSFVVTNTYDDPPDDPDNPDNPPPDDPPPDNPPPDDPPPTDIPDEPPPLDNREPPKNTEDVEPPSTIEDLEDPDVPLANLPQTGQLWWPVPLLGVSGSFLFLVGLVRRKKAAL